MDCFSCLFVPCFSSYPKQLYIHYIGRPYERKERAVQKECPCGSPLGTTQSTQFRNIKEAHRVVAAPVGWWIGLGIRRWRPSRDWKVLAGNDPDRANNSVQRASVVFTTPQSTDARQRLTKIGILQDAHSFPLARRIEYIPEGQNCPTEIPHVAVLWQTYLHSARPSA